MDIADAATVVERGKNMSGSDVVIDVRNLGLTFETPDAPVVALKDINLQIRRGEFVTFIGPSG